MKKILFYLTRYPAIGGIEKVTSMIISVLSDYYQIEIISHRHEDGVSPEVKCPIHLFPNEKKYEAPENIRFYENLLTQGKFDAVVFQDSYAQNHRVVTIAWEKFQIPIYTFEHNSPLFIENKRKLSTIFTLKGFLRRVLHPYLLHRDILRRRHLLECSTRYVLLSKNYIPVFCQLVGVSPSDNRLTYINNPVQQLQNTVDFSAKTKTMLYVGRLVGEKRVDIILKAWGNIFRKLPDWNLEVVGDGPEKTSLEMLALELNLERVSFRGFQNPDEYYRKSSIFLMTSKFEGWGMTLIESMQRGCVPIAMETFHSLRDIITHNINGIITKNDISDFTNKIALLASSPKKIQAMSRQACQGVKRFDIDNIKQQWVKLLG